MKWQRCVSVMAALVLVVTASASRADVFNMGPGLTSLEFVTVGNPGNADDRINVKTAYGGVDYVYAIGKYEVTAGQYTAFLNAVAKTDTYDLYNEYMTGFYGCQIERNVSSGSFTYSVRDYRANRPVNYVSWGDAVRFINWLHNGQPTGAQGPGTTETGAYTIYPANNNPALMAVTREPDAKFWIPTENEWYKAAYYDPNKPGGPGYWNYPTGSDSVPSNQLTSPDPGNNANFYQDGYTNWGRFAWTTDVGAFSNSASPYGTFDQGGNVWEWNEAVVTSQTRGLRGASFYVTSNYMVNYARFTGGFPTMEDGDIGFRVASVPEPGSITLTLGGAIAGLLWWKRRK